MASKPISLDAHRKKHNTMIAKGGEIHHRGKKVVLNPDMAQLVGDAIWDSLNGVSMSCGGGFVFSRSGQKFIASGWAMEAEVTRAQLADIGYELLMHAKEKSLTPEHWRR